MHMYFINLVMLFTHGIHDPREFNMASCVALQFLTLGSEDERQQLIPVITTMLKLSPDEKQLLLTIARGGDEAAPREAGTAGWGAYLHRWSGLS